ncbi:MAG: hypothetical protein GF344_00890, partial [Chitinivibrionales bacterium]|nr:hypothetical protein [Chitinivibrionales bacterium]MBD3355668.1 hypothetical protein [Chitinivibrionales bacterium]
MASRARQRRAVCFGNSMQRGYSRAPRGPEEHTDGSIMKAGKYLRSKGVRWTTRLFLTVLFVYFVNRSLSGREITVILESLRGIHVVGALLLGVGGLWCQAKRWEIILRYERFPVTSSTAWKTLLMGNLFAFVTPGRLGELFRGVGIEEGRKADAVFAVIVDKLFIVATVLLVGLATVFWQAAVRGVAPPFRPVAPVGATIAVCLLAAPLIVRGPKRVYAKPVIRYAARLVRMTPRAFSPAGRLALGCSLGAHLLLLCQTVLLLMMFGVSNAVDALLAAGQAYALMAIVPLFIGNMGIREYAYGLFLSRLGVSPAGAMDVKVAAFGASAAVLTVNLIVPA